MNTSRWLALLWITVVLGGCATLYGSSAAAQPAYDLEPVDRMYHLLAVGFIRAGDLESAEHNAQHALERISQEDHALQMVDVIIYLDTARESLAEQLLINMLGTDIGEEIPSAQHLYLELALASIRAGDVEEADHQLTHYHDAVTGFDRISTREAIELLESGDMHEAEHLVEELMGLTPHEE